MSEKYREIEVYATREQLEKFGHPNYSSMTVKHENCGYNLPPVKCILKIPVPSKKATITEDEFDDFFNGLAIFSPERRQAQEWKQKLFGNGEQ